ncbi:MAG: c-type cytochrome [Sphingobacterium sp.]|uniref:c-type cytochrome n=1 Tax=Sphingobacterium sp. JB170 TaxID=1434842 RepID=UPI000B34AAB8|nr:cytochrome c [Sphingobacterium sp. JB170]
MYNATLTLTGISIVILVIVFACSPNVSIKTAQYASNGQKLYATHCQNCHGTKGEGLGTLYPPLTDSEFLSKNRSQLATIIKYGMNDTIVISGNTFVGPMPGIPSLTDIDIAYILSYVTTTFGNETEIFSEQEVRNNLSVFQ